VKATLPGLLEECLENLDRHEDCRTLVTDH